MEQYMVPELDFPMHLCKFPVPAAGYTLADNT